MHDEHSGHLVLIQLFQPQSHEGAKGLNIFQSFVSLCLCGFLLSYIFFIGFIAGEADSFAAGVAAGAAITPGFITAVPP